MVGSSLYAKPGPPMYKGRVLTATTPRLQHAIFDVYEQFGEVVSVDEKRKNLLKFGRNTDLDTTDNFATVWTLAAETGGPLNESYVTTNAIDTISSSSAADTTQTITIEGHTVSGTGADAEYTFLTQTADLNGQNKVTLTTPVARTSRLAVTTGDAPAGNVFVYEDGAITAGVPNDLTTAHAEILLGETQSYKCATTFSNVDYMFITNFYAGLKRSTAAIADVILEVSQPGQVFRPKFEISVGQGGAEFTLDPTILVPKNSDVRVVAATNTNNTQVNAWFSGYLATVVG